MDAAGGEKDTFDGYNESLNRGKMSIELDMRAPASRPALERLIKWCDVLTENFKSGVMDRMGYGYEACKKINPKIIYCANDGMGPEGDWAGRGSFDGIAQGLSGAMVDEGGGPSHDPRLMEFGAADEVGAMSFAFHILAAIVARNS